MIKSIIFDVGMVLVDYNWRNYLRSFSFDESTYNTIANAVFLSSNWIECDRGVLSEKELLEAFIQNAPLHEEDIRRVLEDVGKCVKQYDYTIPWLKELKKRGYRIYILSNYAQKMYDQTQEELNFLKYTDGGIFSYQDKLIKPDKKIYQTLFQRYDILPEEAVFLDDNLENITAAQTLGLHTIHFANRSSALEELEKLFILYK